MSNFPRPSHRIGQAKSTPAFEKQVKNVPQLLEDGTTIITSSVVDVPLEDISNSLPDPDDLQLEKLMAAGYNPEFVNPVLLNKTNAESIRQQLEPHVESARSILSDGLTND